MANKAVHRSGRTSRFEMERNLRPPGDLDSFCDRFTPLEGSDPMSTLVTVGFIAFQSWQGQALQSQSEAKAVLKLNSVGGFASHESLLCFPFDLIAAQKDYRAFDRVTRMMLAESPVQDYHLSHVARFHHLKSLYLEHTPVTNSSMKQLSGLVELRQLSLGNTQIDDRGIRSLTRLTNLQWLWLDKTPVSDDSIDVLVGFPDLKRLDIRDTKISDNGVARIRESLPRCKILR